MPGPRKPERPRTVPPKVKRAHNLFDIDRIVLMRVALIVIVVVFLYLILQVSLIAFGGSSARKAKRIERAVDTPSVQAPAAVGGTVAPAPAPRAP